MRNSVSTASSLSATIRASDALDPTDATCWQVVLSPSPPTSTSQLLGITALAPDEVWAVGNSAGVITHTLIERWTGSNWVIVPSPSPGASDALHAIDASSPTDIWAVGSTDSQPLVLHYDASGQWSVSPLPYFESGGGLLGVKSFSPDDVWAVGYNTNGSQPLVLHRSAQGWSTISVPTEGALYGIDGVSSNDLWAAGNDDFLHWDGTVWGATQVPVPGGCFFGVHTLFSVSALASNDVWAVGNCPYRIASIGLALTFHWDGTQWSYYDTGLNATQAPVLTSVDAIAPNDVWAVGYQNGVYPNTEVQAIAIHWDGATWTQASIPQYGGGNNMLYGVAAIAHDNVWSAGTFGDASSGNGQTLVQHYSLCAPCPGERFTDVCPTDYFYPYVQALADDGIISGYNTSPPCPNSQWIPCFLPYNSSSRGQISKVVSLAANFTEPVTTQTFEDVPPGSTFYTYTERMAERDIIQGYPCGSPGEPCIPPENRPYFRTNHQVTRGQLSKMVSSAFGWSEPVPYQSFQDVPPGSTFYDYIGRLYNRTIINGYPCGALGEPCVPPYNFPYFRPNNNVTRGQTAKIVQLARTQPTPTPTPTATPLLTTTPLSTPDLTATPTSTGTPATRRY
jgi:hypothetical protein